MKFKKINVLYVISAFCIIGLLFAFFVGQQRKHVTMPSETCDLFFSGDVKISDVPFAKTPLQRTRGLSKVHDAGHGMLFVWEK